MTSVHDDDDQKAEFWSEHHFAVVGASDNDEKWGWKFLMLFRKKGKDVIPINPHLSAIDGVACLKNVADLPEPKTTAIVIVTKPSVTLKVLEGALDLGIPSIWIQPGAWDDAVRNYVEQNRMQDIVRFMANSPSQRDSSPTISTPSLSPVTDGESGSEMTSSASSFSSVDTQDAVPPTCDTLIGLEALPDAISNAVKAAKTTMSQAVETFKDNHHAREPLKATVMDEAKHIVKD